MPGSAQPGGAGSIFSAPGGMANGSLRFDNCGLDGAVTELTGTITVDELQVGPGAVLTHPAMDASLLFDVQGNAHIELDGAIDTTARGFGPGQGPGAAPSGLSGAGGGAYGGNGGWGGDGRAGGATYGDPDKPSTLGSGGGNGQSPAIGGAGGGLIRMDVVGELRVDGTLRANGAHGVLSSVASGGGGSGGSISLVAGTFAGFGTIEAHGGRGGDDWGALNDGGSGGGGRVSVVRAASTFLGWISVCGGTMNGSAQAGGAGTIWTAAPGGMPGDLVVDNCGVDGATTDVGSALVVNDLHVLGAARLSHPASPPRTGSTLSFKGTRSSARRPRSTSTGVGTRRGSASAPVEAMPPTEAPAPPMGGSAESVAPARPADRPTAR